MKNLQLLGFCLSLSFACIKTSAQNNIPVNEPDRNKPKLFSSLPDKIPVTINDLQTLLNAETGKDVSLKLKEGAIASFDGKCVSAAAKYNNTIHSVVIRSSNFNGATLTLSSSAQPNGTVEFTGRIISLQHGDVYVLQNQDDQYILIKKNFYDLINE